MTGILMASVGNSYGSAPVNTVAPVVSGTATVGQTLSTTNGTWIGAPAPTFTYQWQRSGSNIGGATSSTYVLVAADYANTIRCVVTATNAVSAASANSNSTASVAGNAPVNTVAPAVTGTATFGQTLSTTNGTWTGVPTPTFTYQWQRVTTPISGATSSTYVLVAADVGSTVRCVVTATNAVGSASANSNNTATVAAAVPGAPTIGTATNAGAASVTVTYTAPASNGGATITLYTATSSPGGITGTLATAGSGTITVSGLSTGTAYTFTVKATNSAGQSAASAASNSATPALIPSSQIYTAIGTYTWVAPAGVTSVSLLAVGRGGNGGNACAIPICCCQTLYISGPGGNGGSLAYRNNLTVTPGGSYAVGLQSSSGKSYFVSTSYFYAENAGGSGGGSVGSVTAYSGGSGNPGGDDLRGVTGGGGGGAAGYSGNGGGTGSGGPGSNGAAAAACSGGGGGGSGGGNFGSGFAPGGGGGGVGIYGKGATGGVAVRVGTIGATGGNAGSSGGNGSGGGPGGAYGGGGGGAATGGGPSGGCGAVRIVWPGNTRTFPSTCVGAP